MWAIFVDIIFYAVVILLYVNLDPGFSEWLYIIIMFVKNGQAVDSGAFYGENNTFISNMVLLSDPTQ